MRVINPLCSGLPGESLEAKLGPVFRPRIPRLRTGASSKTGHLQRLVWIGVIGCACSKVESAGSPSPGASAGPATASASAVASVRVPRQAPLVDERVDIPGGAFQSGSLPGEAGRKPALEPRLATLELGPFQVDKLPYPNDPGKPPLVGVDREDAKRLCLERGARLCTELEWERACKGPSSDVFPTGSEWNPHCGEAPRNCASGFEVLAMGALVREWTASDVVPGDPSLPRRAAVRGASPQAPAAEHRCAERAALEPGARAQDLGFRCCRGAPNGAKCAEPHQGEIFQKTTLRADRLEKLLRENPRTERLAKDVKLFRDPDAANTVIERGTKETQGFKFTVAPLLWNPSPGAELLLLTGRSGEKTSFVLAYHVLGPDQFSLAASYVMQGEPGPVALAYGVRERVHFSTCWGCPGEMGKILFREPESVAILQP